MQIGPVATMPTLGRPGVVVGQTAIGAPQGGRQYVQVHVQTRVSDEEAGARGVPTAPSAVEAAKSARMAREDTDRDAATEAGEVKEDRLKAAEQRALDELRQRSGQVKQEEQAHAAAAGAAAGPIRYAYQTGPDGLQYAVSGKVSVNLSNVSGDPEALADAAGRLAGAALAAVNPSAADLAVARLGYQAAGMATDVRQESERIDILS